ncbi:MAG: YidC/Oxa1 family membrane protein insertase [Acidimicrobiaceae bacterium]|nr:YidC/Oxa1 family membrane protein insertase [Acidimicrobiaceae bacterium]MYB86215.1 YidC/Oxa1 family membrane protein insertase [Acidimicrobiaceae bacterium]
MFDPLFDVVTAVLAWFYSLLPDYGVAIALLTLTAVVAVTPLTLKMTRNMLQMQQHMPEVKKLQNQYKGDRQAVNEATMAYYKEHGLNPVGCLLPMLVQGPIFLIMFRVVDGLTRRTTEIGTQLGFTSRLFADSASGVAPNYVQTPISRDELPFDPDFLAKDNDLYQDLSKDVEMVSLGVDLSRSASSVISESIVAALPYLLMLVVVLLTSLYQQRQIQGRQSAAAVNPQQQMMMKLIPYMLPVFSYVMPAAVVTYFIVSNLVRIAQQAYITRSFYRGEDSLGAQVAKQRAAAEADGGGPADTQARSSKAVTEGKGAPTPRRDAKPPKAKAPARRRAQGTDKAPARKRTQGTDKSPTRKRTPPQAKTTEQRGRTGKAPSRGRSGSRPGGGRVTPPGSGAKRPSQNRSRSKRKRR